MMQVVLAIVMATQAPDDQAATEALAACDEVFSKSKDASARALAVGVLARVQHEKITLRLGSLLTGDDRTVRLAAAQGLGTYLEATPELRKSAAKVLSSGLSAGVNQKDVEIKVAILTVLGNLGEESAIPAIKNQFDDKDLRVASAAVTAAVAMRNKALIEPMIQLMRDSEKIVKAGQAGQAGTGVTGKNQVPARKDGPDPEDVKRDRAANLIVALRQSLQTLTGQAFYFGDEYERWWSKNKATFILR